MYFLRLGLVGFGGPLAFVASMQKDLVERRRWLTLEEFSRTFAMIKAMPGPVAFQMAVYIGRRYAGAWGGAAAAFGVVAPAFALMVLFGAFLGTYREASGISDFMQGMQATALGVILASAKGLLWPYRSRPSFWLLAALAGALTAVTPSWEPLLILGFGALMALGFELKARARLLGLSLPVFLLGEAASVAVTKAGSWEGAAGELLWASFKAGALVFGSGIAIVPLMEQDFVNRLGWISSVEFMEALALGQVTPGPIVITATYIGFKTLGLAGAMIATVGVFGPPFFHQMTWFPLIAERMARLKWIQPFLLGAIAAVVGAIFATSLRLMIPFGGSIGAMSLIVAALLATLFTKLPVWSLIPLGGFVSLLLRAIGS